VPEGHTLHRLARRHLETFGGVTLQATSPQGRFAAGAARLDGTVLRSAQAHGKHLFLGFASPGRRRADRWLHVHLGLYGRWDFGIGEPPPAKGALRLRIVSDEAWADLRGPTACEVITDAEVAGIRARLGPDPLRRDVQPDRAFARIRRSAVPLGALLMQQDVVSGIGNVYRAEVLFRHRLDPWMPGRDLPEAGWEALWGDLIVLLRDGLRRGRIVTTLPRDRPHRSGPIRMGEQHYVYRRTDLPCFVCGTPVVAEPMAGRTLYRCPWCQGAAGASKAELAADLADADGDDLTPEQAVALEAG
jgi:endonuclease-8